MQLALRFSFIINSAGVRQTRRAFQNHALGAHVFVTMGTGQLARHIAHIVTLIGIRWVINHYPMLIQVTDPGRNGQNIHLTTGIVDVVLSGHIPAGERQ